MFCPFTSIKEIHETKLPRVKVIALNENYMARHSNKYYFYYNLEYKPLHQSIRMNDMHDMSDDLAKRRRSTLNMCL